MDALHHACIFGDKKLKFVKYLLENGADVNCVNNDGKYPIHIACGIYGGAMKLIECLIENCADINCVNIINGCQPIHYACRNSFRVLEIVKYL